MNPESFAIVSIPEHSSKNSSWREGVVIPSGTRGKYISEEDFFEERESASSSMVRVELWVLASETSEEREGE
jgi:hypothetical protein